MLALSIVWAFGGCGGGGSAGQAGGAGASASISMVSATAFPAATSFATTADVASVSPAAVATTFDNVLVAVTRIALIPSGGAGLPDVNGQLEAQNSASEETPAGEGGFVTVTLPSPVTIDLMHPPTGVQAAKLLNKFGDIPAGSYGKIRIYYDNVVGWSQGTPTLFHSTAHYHFDVHFVGGDLVIPVAANAVGGVRFFAIDIKLVGLRIQQAGNSANVLIRPQVFATVGPPKYLVSGVASGVNSLTGNFDIRTSDNQVFHARFDASTGWLFLDGRFVAPDPAVGPEALRDTAIVDAIGTFQAGTLVAEEVGIAFPAALSGIVAGGWQPDNTFVLRLPADNIVLPRPFRLAAFYDAAAFPHERLPDTAVVDNVFVKARGYLTAGGIEAFWISIGP
jgi:hypothetical protein